MFNNKGFNIHNKLKTLFFDKLMNTANFKTRYSRQIRLPRIGTKGQAILAKSNIFIVGMGVGLARQWHCI